jgi:hypothetical protein
MVREAFRRRGRFRQTCFPQMVMARIINKSNLIHLSALIDAKHDRWKVRSQTYPGIAEAMAEQWSEAPLHS